jgi:hypothetical protein
MENRGGGQAARDMVGGPDRPRGFTHRPEDLSPAEPDLAGNNTNSDQHAGTSSNPEYHPGLQKGETSRSPPVTSNERCSSA